MPGSIGRLRDDRNSRSFCLDIKPNEAFVKAKELELIESLTVSPFIRGPKK
jgi:hypothetical protein